MTWLVRMSIVLLYPRTADLPGAEDCDLDAFLARFRSETTTLMWLGVVVGALVFQLTPILTVSLPLPAFALPAELANRHAERITTTRIYLLRQAIFLVKLVAGLAWGADPRVRERFALKPHTGDPGTWRSS
jgi:hypothetical protein